MNHVVYAGMRKLCDTGVLGNQFEVVSERSFPAQRFVLAAQIFQTFTDVEFFVAILLLHSLWNLFGFRALDSVWGEATLCVSDRSCVGELAVHSSSKPRDTPHARVSMSYVLEA